MKHIRALIVFVLLLVLATNVTLAQDTVFTAGQTVAVQNIAANDSLNCRQEPNTDSPVLAQMPNGTQATVKVGPTMVALSGKQQPWYQLEVVGTSTVTCWAAQRSVEHTTEWLVPFAVEQQQQLVIMTPQPTPTAQPVIDTSGITCSDFAVSPDNTKIACTGISSDNHQDIYVVTPGARTVLNITNSPSVIEWGAKWFNNSTILYFSLAGVKADTYVIEITANGASAPMRLMDMTNLQISASVSQSDEPEAALPVGTLPSCAGFLYIVTENDTSITHSRVDAAVSLNLLKVGDELTIQTKHQSGPLVYFIVNRERDGVQTPAIVYASEFENRIYGKCDLENFPVIIDE